MRYYMRIPADMTLGGNGCNIVGLKMRRFVVGDAGKFHARNLIQARGVTGGVHVSKAQYSDSDPHIIPF